MEKEERINREEAEFEKAIAASSMGEGFKKALKERTMQVVRENSQVKTIFGLETKPDSSKKKITLGNGLTINADAFDG